jgi:hypothetical protein
MRGAEAGAEAGTATNLAERAIALRRSDLAGSFAVTPQRSDDT